MKFLADLKLPRGYSVVRDADGLALFAPDGECIALFGECYSVDAVTDLAWLHAEEDEAGDLA